MADQAEPVAQEDPYDLGDTSTNLSPEPAAQPRNPDGTFASATPPEPPAPKHPPYLIEQAKDFGLSDAEIDETPSNLLGQQLYRLQKLQRQYDREMASAQTSARAQERPPAAPAEPDLGLDKEIEESLDPTLIAWMKRMMKENAELKQAHQQTRQALQQREDETRAQAIDRIICADGRFGTDSITDLHETAPERAKRIAIATIARQLAGERASFDKFLQKIPEAITRLYGTKEAVAPLISPPSGSEPTPRVTKEQWNAAGLARPTQRNGAAEPKGDAKAVANLEARMKERGMIGSPGDAEILDGLPE